MDDAGQKLKHARERLGLRYRDVEIASLQIAQRHNNDEFAIALSRLSDIENKGVIPTIFRIYSLCAIYRLDLNEVLEWYGIDLGALPADAASLELERSHLVGFHSNGFGQVLFPLSLDPGIDFKKTTYLSRMIQRWGKLPLAFLDGLDLKQQRYAFIGSQDWSMYPLLQPGSLVLIDDARRKVVNDGWSNEFERPIYFVEHRDGYTCGWCTIDEPQNQLVVLAHPASQCLPRVFRLDEVDIVGQVAGVAMLLDRAKRRRARA